MKILIVRVSSLGDLIHNMPLVHDLQRHYPAAKIDWVVEEAYTGLVALCPGLHRIIPVALRRWRKQLFCAATWQQIGHFYRSLKLESYDLVFDTQGLLKTGLIMKIARLGANGKRIGLANATADSGYEALSRIFHTHSIAIDFRTHAVERSRIVAAKAGGYTVDQPPQFDLQTPVLVENLSTLRPELARCLETSHYLVFFSCQCQPQKKLASRKLDFFGETNGDMETANFSAVGQCYRKSCRRTAGNAHPDGHYPAVSIGNGSCCNGAAGYAGNWH